VRPQLPWVHSPQFPAELATRFPDPEEAQQADFFRRHGYLVLEGLFDLDLLDRVIAESQPGFRNEVAEGPRSRVRAQDLWSESPAVRALACHRRLLELLRRLYDREPFPFQTLNFQYGTQQRAHQDRRFFNTFPGDYMCAAWVALEDVGPENGTLFYYPGSHLLPDYDYDDLGLGFRNLLASRRFDDDRARLPYEFMERLAMSSGLERRELTASKGTVLLWAAGLMHGGSPIRDSRRTRLSQVTHYFFQDCLYLTPIYCNRGTGDLYLRRVENVLDGRAVPNVYQGLAVEGVQENGHYKLLLGEENGREVARAVPLAQLANERYLLYELLGSASLRLGRALTSPLRAVKRWLAGGAGEPGPIQRDRRGQRS
jgi:ectoine hydroxylase-related dioxygenase (phytanoyl-CoA dioxygenase family)